MPAPPPPPPLCVRRGGQGWTPRGEEGRGGGRRRRCSAWKFIFKGDRVECFLNVLNKYLSSAVPLVPLATDGLEPKSNTSLNKQKKKPGYFPPFLFPENLNCQNEYIVYHIKNPYLALSLLGSNTLPSALHTRATLTSKPLLATKALRSLTSSYLN